VWFVSFFVPGLVVAIAAGWAAGRHEQAVVAEMTHERSARAVSDNAARVTL
jgi:hypothetical protein